MENVAFHSIWAAELTEALLHIWSPLGGVQIAKGGQVSVTDLLNSIFLAGDTTLKLTKKMPLAFLPGADHWYDTVLGLSPRVVAHTAGSFQGFHTKASARQRLQDVGDRARPVRRDARRSARTRCRT